MLFRPCIPAENEPVFRNSECHPLIELENPFCQHYGFKLDKIVFDYETSRQQEWNNDLWDMQRQYEEVNFGEQKLEPPAKCYDQARFLGCYHTFQGCDETRSVFRPKKVCKETCLSFLNDCGAFVELWKELHLSRFPKDKALLNCLEQPRRNAGDSPECMYYAKEEILEREGMV